MKKSILIVLIASLLLSFTSLQAKQKVSSVATRYLRDAKMKLQQKDLDQSLSFYLKVLETDPNCVEALVKIGQINYSFGSERTRDKMNYYVTAYEYYNKALAAYDQLLAEGTPEKKLKEEAKLIEAVNKEVNYPVQKILVLGDTAYNDEDYESALIYFQKVFELDPTSSTPLKYIAQIYLNLKSDDEEVNRQNKENAIKTLEQIKEIDPKDTQNLQVLASMYFNMEQVVKAIEVYNAILEITPNDIDVLFNVSIAYSNQNLYDKSLEMSERILAIEPDNVDALDNASQFAKYLKLDDKAVEYSIHLIELEPTAEKIENLCYTLSQAKKWDQLLTFAQRWYELAPDNQRAIQMVLVAAVQTDNKAIKAEFEKKLKALPKK